MRSAFTLIEIVIVLSIFAIIAVFGVNAFSISRQNIQIELATADTVARLHQLRNESESLGLCFIIELTNGVNPHVAQSKYDGDTKTCDDKELKFRPVITEVKQVAISTIEIDGVINDSLRITIAPPFGEVSFDKQGDLLSLTLALTTNKVFSRTIEVERATGRIEG